MCFFLSLFIVPQLSPSPRSPVKSEDKRAGIVMFSCCQKPEALPNETPLPPPPSPNPNPDLQPELDQPELDEVMLKAVLNTLEDDEHDPGLLSPTSAYIAKTESQEDAASLFAELSTEINAQILVEANALLVEQERIKNSPSHRKSTYILSENVNDDDDLLTEAEARILATKPNDCSNCGILLIDTTLPCPNCGEAFLLKCL